MLDKDVQVIVQYTYTYDARNKLIRATVQSGQQVSVEEYAYDFAGNRIAKIGEISTTYYLVDTNGALSQVLAEYDENGIRRLSLYESNALNEYTRRTVAGHATVLGEADADAELMSTTTGTFFVTGGSAATGSPVECLVR